MYDAQLVLAEGAMVHVQDQKVWRGRCEQQSGDGIEEGSCLKPYCGDMVPV